MDASDIKLLRAMKLQAARGPGGRTVRQRWARAKRAEGRAGAVDRAVARRESSYGGSPVDFAPRRIGVGRGFHN